MRVCILCSEPRIQGSHSVAQTSTDRNALGEMEEGGRKGERQIQSRRGTVRSKG